MNPYARQQGLAKLIRQRRTIPREELRIPLALSIIGWTGRDSALTELVRCRLPPSRGEYFTLKTQRQHMRRDTDLRTYPQVRSLNKKGLLSYLPRSFGPFAELSRVDKPAGTAYLLMPCLFGTLLASTVASPTPDPLTILRTGLLFSLGAAVMRGAGCTINDLYDRNLDKLVERTRLRPLASDAVSVPAALTWAVAQCLVGFTILLQFPSNAVVLALPSMILVCTYPLAKRFTHYPQLVLGSAFSWGSILGFQAMGLPLINFNLVVPDLEDLSFQTLMSAVEDVHIILGDANVIAAAGLLYASCISWTLLYDTIYAFQDIRDDRKAGIKSTAQAFSSKNLAANLIDRRPKVVLASLGFAQTALLVSSGFMLGLSPVFYLSSCVGCAATAGLIVHNVQLHNVASCAWWFRMGCWITGGAINLGLAAEYGATVLSSSGSHL